MFSLYTYLKTCSTDLEMQSQSSMFHTYTILREGHKFIKLYFTLKNKKKAVDIFLVYLPRNFKKKNWLIL